MVLEYVWDLELDQPSENQVFEIMKSGGFMWKTAIDHLPRYFLEIYTNNQLIRVVEFIFDR